MLEPATSASAFLRYDLTGGHPTTRALPTKTQEEEARNRRQTTLHLRGQSNRLAVTGIIKKERPVFIGPGRWAYLGAGAASEDAASGEERSGSALEEARLRSASGKAEEEDEDKEAGAEPGRRRVRVRVSAVSSKSSPEAAEDSVELRSVSTDMAGGGVLGSARGGFLFFVWARRGRGRGRGRKRKRQRG